MADFQKTIKTTELASGAMKVLTLQDKNIVIANAGGKFYAFDDACPHMKARLSFGLLMGTTLMCLAHGNKYDLTTGKKVEGQGDGELKTYEVRIDGDDVLVKI